MGMSVLAGIAKREEVRMRLTRFLSGEAAELLLRESQEEVAGRLETAMAQPVNERRPLWGDWFKVFCTAEEIALYECMELPQDARVLEVASGNQISVPLSVECYTAGCGGYTTANLNRGLTEHFRRLAAQLTIPLRIIEDDAVRLDRHVEEPFFDAAVFQHAVNDVLQSIVADQLGLDTVNGDWFGLMPAMVGEMARRYREGSFEDSVRPEFLKLIGSVCKGMKAGGVFFFTHWEYQFDLQAGYPPELYREMIPMVRRWIADSGLPLAEVEKPGFDPQYRLILRKTVSPD